MAYNQGRQNSVIDDRVSIPIFYKILISMLFIATLPIILLGIVSIGGTASIVEALGLEISIILITLITITVILMWSNYLAHQITDPIVQLSSVATRISKGDLIDTRIDIESNDEIGELVAAFNRMVNTYRILDTLAKEGTSPE
ncbi:MAG TPA: HAMP domain-containing protein [Methanoregulaceae archaeon]|nr:HAMP domain-containing protein [Methanoregulaceae archaeon]